MGSNMEENLLSEAIKFMGLGMSVVFTFLIVTVYAIKLQAALINKFFPIVEKQVTQKTTQPQTAGSNTAVKVAAISAVIQHHNNLKG